MRDAKRSVFVVWQEANSVGNTYLDAQHRQILELLNAMYERVRGTGDVNMTELVSRLSDYTRRHFRDEERYLQQFGFPSLVEHQAVDRGLRERTEGIRRGVEKGVADVDDSVLQFLKQWWLSHINQTDRQYAVHLGTRGRSWKP